MAGTEVVSFSTVMNEVPQKFWHGNRLYAEISWDTIKRPRTFKRTLGRQFIDPLDRKPDYLFERTSNKAMVISLSVILPILALVGAGVGYFFYRRYKLKYSFQQ